MVSGSAASAENVVEHHRAQKPPLLVAPLSQDRTIRPAFLRGCPPFIQGRQMAMNGLRGDVFYSDTLLQLSAVVASARWCPNVIGHSSPWPKLSPATSDQILRSCGHGPDRRPKSDSETIRRVSWPVPSGISGQALSRTFDRWSDSRRSSSTLQSGGWVDECRITVRSN